MSRLRPRLAALLLAFAASAFGAGATPGFVADPAVRDSAEHAAADAVKLAQQFSVKLDGSEGSIDDVERVLDKLHTTYSLASSKPADSELMPFAQAFGAYVGEVYRRNHGATWGTVTLNGSQYPGFRTDNGVNVWPVGRVLNRITDGPDNNIAFFYRKLVEGPPRD